MSISRGSKPSKPHNSGGSLSENQTAREDRVRKRTTDLWKDQSPEGRKLRSVAGVKETRQGNRGGLRQDRPAGSVEMHRVGSDGSWQPRPSRPRLLYAGEPEKPREVVFLAGTLGCGRRTVWPR